MIYWELSNIHNLTKKLANDAFYFSRLTFLSLYSILFFSEWVSWCCVFVMQCLFCFLSTTIFNERLFEIFGFCFTWYSQQLVVGLLLAQISLYPIYTHIACSQLTKFFSANFVFSRFHFLLPLATPVCSIAIFLFLDLKFFSNETISDTSDPSYIQNHNLFLSAWERLRPPSLIDVIKN